MEYHLFSTSTIFVCEAVSLASQRSLGDDGFFSVGIS